MSGVGFPTMVASPRTEDVSPGSRSGRMQVSGNGNGIFWPDHASPGDSPPINQQLEMMKFSISRQDFDHFEISCEEKDLLGPLGRQADDPTRSYNHPLNENIQYTLTESRPSPYAESGFDIILDLSSPAQEFDILTDRFAQTRLLLESNNRVLQRNTQDLKNMKAFLKQELHGEMRLRLSPESISSEERSTLYDTQVAHLVGLGRCRAALAASDEALYQSSRTLERCGGSALSSDYATIAYQPNTYHIDQSMDVGEAEFNIKVEDMESTRDLWSDSDTTAVTSGQVSTTSSHALKHTPVLIQEVGSVFPKTQMTGGCAIPQTHVLTTNRDDLAESIYDAPNDRSGLDRDGAHASENSDTSMNDSPTLRFVDETRKVKEPFDRSYRVEKKPKRTVEKQNKEGRRKSARIKAMLEKRNQEAASN